MAAMDTYNKLELACSDSPNYPSNALRTRLFRHTLGAYKTQLQGRTKDLFESIQEYPIEFLEAYDGERFRKWPCKTASALQQHFKINRKDPACRHVFIQAETSRSPLDCSADVFTLLLSFHQVMPRFLDLVFSFGRQPGSPSDFHYTTFYHENYLEQNVADEYKIPRLGRSGRQIQNCYNLWGVEKSDADGSWSFRQTATYHAFDVDFGRAFWLNIKANDLMLNRITDVETAPGRPDPRTATTSCSRFAQSLTTHLVIFEWCSENWRPFLTSLESEMRSILTRAKNAPIEEVERTLTVDFQALISPTTGSPTSPTALTFPRGGNDSRSSTGLSLQSRTRRVLSGLATTPEVPTLPTPGSHIQQAVPNNPISADHFGVLKEFSVKSLQRLGGIGSKLQQAALIMRLNIQILRSVRTHYRELLKDSNLPDELRTGCVNDLAAFSEQAEGYIHRLELELAQVATLEAILKDGKELFDTILHFRNMEINKLFTVNAQETANRVEDMTHEMHKSTLRMERLTKITGRIAQKTERETSSMHIITLVTLVFLPGTFVAVRYGLPQLVRLLADQQTLFGSGLFQWDQNRPEMPFPLWKQEYFDLFAKICFPLMAGVIIIWYIVYWFSKRRGNKRGANDEEMQMLAEDEKLGVASS